MKYGYEKMDHRGNIVYPMYPVVEDGCYIAGFIVGNGYVPVSDITYGSEAACRKDCDVHNNYHGWTELEVDGIFFRSMTNKFHN